MRRAEFLKRLQAAQKRVGERITQNTKSGGVYARGLATEGYEGGYRDALGDVEAMLRHGMPTDVRGFWKTES